MRKIFSKIKNFDYVCKPVDGGNFFFTPKELNDFLKYEPVAEKYIRQILGADEFINGKLRYCLWLVECPPNEKNAACLSAR